VDFQGPTNLCVHLHQTQILGTMRFYPDNQIARLVVGRIMNADS